ncbi:MAG: hypothetical protein ACPIOQ_30235 [Promethearchaeia archaeon]
MRTHVGKGKYTDIDGEVYEGEWAYGEAVVDDDLDSAQQVYARTRLDLYRSNPRCAHTHMHANADGCRRGGHRHTPPPPDRERCAVAG